VYLSAFGIRILLYLSDMMHNSLISVDFDKGNLTVKFYSLWIIVEMKIYLLRICTPVHLALKGQMKSRWRQTVQKLTVPLCFAAIAGGEVSVSVSVWTYRYELSLPGSDFDLQKNVLSKPDKGFCVITKVDFQQNTEQIILLPGLLVIFFNCS
jgi:hypothetical protein